MTIDAVFKFPERGRLSAQMLAAYQRVGFLALSEFVSVEECKRLMARAERLVADFEPEDTKVIFFGDCITVSRAA